MGAASPKPAPYLNEARALYNLINDGHGRLRYHVSRGPALRDVTTGKVCPESMVPRGLWLPARDVGSDGKERDRLLNPYVVRQHLLGKYDVASEAPSWTSLVVFDVDRHLPEGMGEEECHPELVKVANEYRDEMMERLWKGLGLEEKEPVVLMTPNKGYHVYLPVCRVAGEPEAERTWPAGVLRERVEYRLHRSGLHLEPGRLELFPSGSRLRLPCGAGMQLLDEDLEPVEGTYNWSPRNQWRTTRRIAPLVWAFCSAIERARKPLEEWLDQRNVRWTPKWGPWGTRRRGSEKNDSHGGKGEFEPDRHIVESIRRWGAPPEPAGFLLYGREFFARIHELDQFGLRVPGERHDAALKLIWYWMVCRGCSAKEAVDRLSDWLEHHEHISNLLPAFPRKFFDNTRREARHYANVLDRRLATRVRRTLPRSPDLAPPVLGRADSLVVDRTPVDLHPEIRALLRHLLSHADRSGRVPHPVNLSGDILSRVCGSRRLHVHRDDRRQYRRCYVMAVEYLVDLGILALHTDYSTGHHGKLYTCWYRFGSGTLPARDDRGHLVLAQRNVEEGLLQVLANGSQPPSVRLFLDQSSSTTPDALASPDAFGRLWWVRMFQRRAFTPAEFLEGDAGKLVPGSFRHRRTLAPVEVVPRPARPVGYSNRHDPRMVPPRPEQPPPDARGAERAMPEPEPIKPVPLPEPFRPALSSQSIETELPTLERSQEPPSPRLPAPPLPSEIEELLDALPPGELREQVRATWLDWLQHERGTDSS